MGPEGCTGPTHTSTKPVPTNTCGECVRVCVRAYVCNNDSDNLDM